jgi:uncharacterized flavoprotein (TIGR03862 family)
VEKGGQIKQIAFVHSIKPVAIIGSGPAGLMAAHVLASAGYAVKIFEKRPGAGRKILIAGSSGLNISFDSPLDEFIQNYQGPRSQWERILKKFPPQAWLSFVESLGLETFRGTSRRYFVKGMKGSGLLRSWVESLKKKGVEFFFLHECIDFDATRDGVCLTFENGEQIFSAVCFCLGGGSWEKEEKPLRWPTLFKKKNLRFKEFSSANSGFKVEWTQAFLKEAEGLPLKGVVFHSKKGSRAGELVVTSYGLEGTPIYTIGESGNAWIDLKPSFNEKQILEKLSSSKENLSPLRRVKKYLNLSPGAFALVFHFSPKEEIGDLKRLIARIKRFPIQLGERQPLEEAISSSGGLEWIEVDQSMMLKSFPGVFAAGEMLDWHAPTGGFLIQGCVSQGYVAGMGMVEFLRKSNI